MPFTKAFGRLRGHVEAATSCAARARRILCFRPFAESQETLLRCFQRVALLSFINKVMAPRLATLVLAVRDGRFTGVSSHQDLCTSSAHAPGSLCRDVYAKHAWECDAYTKCRGGSLGSARLRRSFLREFVNSCGELFWSLAQQELGSFEAPGSQDKL